MNFLNAMHSLPSKAALDTFDEVVKVVAVAVGAAWTALNYARGRTFKLRSEIELTGKIRVQNGVQYFVGECTAKNVGLSKIGVKPAGTGISVYALWLVTRPSGEVRVWASYVTSVPVVEKAAWIEPGETLSRSVMAVLPKEDWPLLGVRVDTMICNAKGSIWSSSAVIEVEESKEKEKQP